MEAKDVKHGIAVTVMLEGCLTQFEVLERSGPSRWWLHRWTYGHWQTTECHARDMLYTSDGARQEYLSADLASV